MILMYHYGFSKRSKHTIQHLWKAGLGTAKISFLPSFELLRRRLWGPILNDSRWSFRHGTLNSNSSKSDNMSWKPWGVHGETPIETQISRESTPCHLLRFSQFCHRHPRFFTSATPVSVWRPSRAQSVSATLRSEPTREQLKHAQRTWNTTTTLTQHFCGVQGGAKKIKKYTLHVAHCAPVTSRCRGSSEASFAFPALEKAARNSQLPLKLTSADHHHLVSTFTGCHWKWPCLGKSWTFMAHFLWLVVWNDQSL